jgi:hypothetical protein
MLLKVLKIICVLCFSFDNTLKEGTFVRNVHSILAQNCFLEASGNFSTNVPFYRDPFSQLPMNDDHLYGDPDYPWDAYLQS